MIAVDFFIGVLSSLPTLSELDIQTQWWEEKGTNLFSYPDMPQEWSPSIRKLTLGDIHPEHHRMKEVQQLLETNTNLRSLRLTFSQEYDSPVTDTSYLLGVVSALGVNETLEKLMLHFYSEIQLDTVLVALAKAIEKCPDSSLKDLDVEAPNLVCKLVVHEALIKMLQTNYSLEEVEFRSTREELESENLLHHDCGRRAEIDLYLRLNQLGRKNLMRNGNGFPGELWVGEFLKLSLDQDLDGLFYYLRRNPWLFQDEPPNGSNLKSHNLHSRDDKPRKRKLEERETTIAQLEEELKRARSEIAELKDRLKEKTTK